MNNNLIENLSHFDNISSTLVNGKKYMMIIFI